MADEKKPEFKVYYNIERETLKDGVHGEKTDTTLSVSSDSNEGVWDLFQKLKNEVLKNDS